VGLPEGNLKESNVSRPDDVTNTLLLSARDDSLLVSKTKEKYLRSIASVNVEAEITGAGPFPLGLSQHPGKHERHQAQGDDDFAPEE
jgi:hypothetical protein